MFRPPGTEKTGLNLSIARCFWLGYLRCQPFPSNPHQKPAGDIPVRQPEITGRNSSTTANDSADYLGRALPNFC